MYKIFFFFLGEEYIKSLLANPELVDRLSYVSNEQVNAQTIYLNCAVLNKMF